MGNLGLLGLQVKLEELNVGQRQIRWNKQQGKNPQLVDYGRLWCSACGREWPWLRRHQCLKAACVPLTRAPAMPRWVVRLNSTLSAEVATDTDAPCHVNNIGEAPTNVEQLQMRDARPPSVIPLPGCTHITRPEAPRRTRAASKRPARPCAKSGPSASAVPVTGSDAPRFSRDNPPQRVHRELPSNVPRMGIG